MAQQNSSQSNKQSDQKSLGSAVLKQVAKVARNRLENVGAGIDGINVKRNQLSNYHAADLSAGSDSIYKLMQANTSTGLTQFIGNYLTHRFSSYTQVLKRIIPDEVIDKGLDSVFEQLAGMAESWSKFEVSHDRKIEDYANLTESERNAIAKNIANQNRALATMGGVTGLVGLPGMLADTFWLLLVSLRTVYQLAAVYGQPLNGKQGIKAAYAVIASSDLSQMAPKQAILAGLGVAHAVIDNVQENGFEQEIKQKMAKTGVANPRINQYAGQVDKLVEQFDINLEDINLTWVKRLVAWSSVAAGMHYNSILIEQIIGTTQATFAPAIKIANEDDTV